MNLSGRFDGPGDFPTLLRLASSLAEARTAVPPMYRGCPGDVLATILQAQALDVPIMAALQHTHWNPTVGKGGMSAQLMSALLLRAGVTWTELEVSDKQVSMRFTRADGKPGGDVSWRITEAVAAGLVKPGSPWEHYPADTLWARCLARGARRFGADVVMGMGYTPEEAQLLQPDEPAPTEPEQVTGEVTAFLDSLSGFTAEQIRRDGPRLAKKAGVADAYAGTSNGQRATVSDVLLRMAMAASAREAAVRADAAATTPPAEPAAVADPTRMPCGCVKADVVATGAHDTFCPTQTKRMPDAD